MRLEHILPLMLLFVLSAAAARGGEKTIETMPPKREMTPTQKEQAEDLKRRIEAEKKRLAEVRKPLDAILAELKDPEAQLREIGGATRQIGNIIEDGEKTLKDIKSKEAKEVFDKIEEQAKKLGSNGKEYAALSMEIIEAKIAIRLDKEAKRDSKRNEEKLKGAEQKKTRLEERMTGRLRETIAVLDDKKREEEAKLNDESAQLRTMRAQLSMLYGYEVESGAIAFAGSQESGDHNIFKWIDEQGTFIERLSAWGYDDLANAMFEKVEKSSDPFSGKALSDEARNYLNKVGAKLRLRKAISSKDMREKMVMGQEALTLYEGVVSRLVPQTPAHVEAVTELISARFELADSIYETSLRDALFAGDIPVAKALPDLKTYKPLTAEPLKALDPKALNQAATDYVNYLYASGMELALPLQQRLQDTFLDLIDDYMDARESGDKTKENTQYRYLERFSPIKLRLQHVMEDGYGNWPRIFAPGSPQRAEIVEKGNLFVDDNMTDYKEIWPNDKTVYLHWMMMQAVMPDPIFEKTSAGRPLPKFDQGDPDEWKELSAADKREEAMVVTRYPWMGDRIDNIFTWHLVGKEKGASSKNPAMQAMRQRGLYSWIAARTELARSHLRWADAESDAATKQAILEHAQKLVKSATDAMNELDSGRSQIGEVDSITCNRGKLNVVIPFNLFMAAREIRNGNKEKGAEWATLALNEAATLHGSTSGGWRGLANDALILVAEFNKKNDISGSDDPAAWPPALLATRAEKFLSDGLAEERAGRMSKARANFNSSRELYMIILDKARDITAKTEREALLVKTLYNLGAVSVKLEDYVTAIIANQALAQEFRNDFADPARNYPPEQFPNVQRYFANALNNLRAASYRQMVLTGSRGDKNNYIDALLMNVRSSGRGEDYVELINTLKDMRDYESAVNFIDNVPADNDYYRITQLMASDIYLTLINQRMRRVQELREALNPKPDEDGNIPAEKVLKDDEKKKTEQQLEGYIKEIAGYRQEADKYARKFIDLHGAAVARWQKEEEQGVRVGEAVQRIRMQERTNLLQAMMIPILIAFESGEYANVLKMTPDYYAAVEQQKEIPEDQRAANRLTVLWLSFVSQHHMVDYATVELAAAAQNLQQTQQVLEEMKKFDTENRHLGDAASLLGGAWLNLANRARAAGQDDLDRQYSLNAVDWFDQAESRIYESLGVGVRNGATLTEQKLYARAEDLLSKVVSFWSESLFTPRSLFQPGQGKDGMKEMNPAVASSLVAAFRQDKIAAAAQASDEELVKQLNDLVAGVKFEDHAENFNRAIDSALKAYKDERRLLRSLEQAKQIAESFAAPDKNVEALLKRRAYLDNKPSLEQRNRLNRILLEAAYPKTLFTQPESPLLPSPVVTLTQTIVLEGFYTSAEGRRKAAVLMAMIDPESIKGRSAEEVVFGGREEGGKGGYVGELTQLISETEDEALKARYSRVLNALNNPLVVALYGVPDRQGRLRDRSYHRARGQVATMLEFDRDNPTTEDIPIRDYLRNLDNALNFQNFILLAKKNYARAMVENGNYVNAERYVKELGVLFPGDWTLSLDLGDIYTKMAMYEDKNGKREPRPYSNEAAKLYLQGQMQINGVLKYAPLGSDPYWNATLQSFESEVAALEARARAGDEFAGAFKVQVTFFDPMTGESRASSPTIQDIKTRGLRAAVDIQRMLDRPEPKVTEEVEEKMRKLLERLAKLGYSPAAAAATAE